MDERDNGKLRYSRLDSLAQRARRERSIFVTALLLGLLFAARTGLRRWTRVGGTPSGLARRGGDPA